MIRRPPRPPLFPYTTLFGRVIRAPSRIREPLPPSRNAGIFQKKLYYRTLEIKNQEKSFFIISTGYLRSPLEPISRGFDFPRAFFVTQGSLSTQIAGEPGLVVLKRDADPLSYFFLSLKSFNKTGVRYT